MTKLTSLGDAHAKQQDQPLSGAGESFIGKISGPIEKPVRRQKTRRTENAQVKEEAAQQTVSETKETKLKRTRTAQNTDAHKKTTKTVKSAPNGEKAPAKTTKSTQTAICVLKFLYQSECFDLVRFHLECEFLVVARDFLLVNLHKITFDNL